MLWVEHQLFSRIFPLGIEAQGLPATKQIFCPNCLSLGEPTFSWIPNDYIIQFVFQATAYTDLLVWKSLIYNQRESRRPGGVCSDLTSHLWCLSQSWSQFPLEYSIEACHFLQLRSPAPYVSLWSVPRSCTKTLCGVLLLVEIIISHVCGDRTQCPFNYLTNYWDEGIQPLWWCSCVLKASSMIILVADNSVARSQCSEWQFKKKKQKKN